MERLKAAFVEGLGIPRDSDFESLSYRGIPEWGSVAHMQLVSQIECAFDIMLETDDVIDMSSFAKAKEIVITYLACAQAGHAVTLLDAAMGPEQRRVLLALYQPEWPVVGNPAKSRVLYAPTTCAASSPAIGPRARASGRR